MDLAKTGAALVASLLVLLPVVAGAQAITDAEANRHYRNAEKLWKESDYEGARAEYQAAYDIEPNLAILYNIGRMHELEREFHEAVAIYQRIVSDPAAPIELRKAAQAGVDVYGKWFPERYDLTVEVATEGASITVDGKLAGEGRRALVKLVPGKHEVLVVAEGHDDRTVEIDLQAVSGTRPNQFPARPLSFGSVRKRHSSGSRARVFVTRGLKYRNVSCTWLPSHRRMACSRHSRLARVCASDAACLSRALTPGRCRATVKVVNACANRVRASRSRIPLSPPAAIHALSSRSLPRPRSS